jgi:alkanesulfonate monooxygenase SsuD/methylene tetrahydromethanopterin reductase-like flavin-dependent oxidoreductase (luciferase family)
MRAHMAAPPPSGQHGAGTVPADAPAPQARGPVISDDESIAGSPASVARQIIDQCRRCGAGHILAYPFGTLSREHVARSDELWREVIPLLRLAELE